jgi:hypothetical protein
MVNAAYISTVWGNPDDPDFEKDYLEPLDVAVQATKNGTFEPVTIQVHKLSLIFFRSFLVELANGGYIIRDISSYVNRDIRGSTTHKSQHAWGNAIDINPTENPSVEIRQENSLCNMPAGIEALAAKYHLIWGGGWHHPYDPMHFEFDGFGVNQ